jgi:hypothetical protein
MFYIDLYSLYLFMARVAVEYCTTSLIPDVFGALIDPVAPTATYPLTECCWIEGLMRNLDDSRRVKNNDDNLTVARQRIYCMQNTTAVCKCLVSSSVNEAQKWGHDSRETGLGFKPVAQSAPCHWISLIQWVITLGRNIDSGKRILRIWNESGRPKYVTNRLGHSSLHVVGLASRMQYRESCQRRA